MDRIELLQTHCIPQEVMRSGEIWSHLRKLQERGTIRHFGASVESTQEAHDALEVEGIGAVQLIFNIFRQRPSADLFDRARDAGVSLIARLPLASGLLSGKLTRESSFPANDHRRFNRSGEAFHVGETFAGLPFETGLALTERVRTLVPEGMSTAQFALRWCLDHGAVTTVIPGAKRPEQARENAAAAERPPLAAETHAELRRLWREEVSGKAQGKV